jgi:hypothetical protein
MYYRDPDNNRAGADRQFRDRRGIAGLLQSRAFTDNPA